MTQFLTRIKEYLVKPRKEKVFTVLFFDSLICKEQILLNFQVGIFVKNFVRSRFLQNLMSQREKSKMKKREKEINKGTTGGMFVENILHVLTGFRR